MDSCQTVAKFSLAIFLVFTLALGVLVVANGSQSIDRIYSTAQYTFTAERQSFLPQTCVRFRWTATHYTAIIFDGEPVESPGEKTVCEYGDVKRVLTVVYADGNPLTYGLRVPGGLGLSGLALAVMGGLAFVSALGARLPYPRVRPHLPQRWRLPRLEHTQGAPRAAAIATCYALTFLAPLAAIQAFYPAILRDSWRDWALYWLYLAGGVIAPGTLLLLASMRWRADWLTWLGLGWAVGHGVELVTLLVAKQLGSPSLFALWIPLAYLFALASWRRGHGGRRWRRKVAPLQRRGPAGIALAILVLIGTACFVSLNLAELSPRPPYVSDVWFHINNAHEFRDHSPVQDPRLAGEPFNYHLFSYAPSAAASLMTGAPVANLVARYAGLSSVWLLTLLLFNAGRALARGSALSGFFAALLIILPLDIFALLSSGFAVGTFLMFYGVYLSTTTLGGYIYLAALLLPVWFQLRRPEPRTLGVIALLSFAGAGAKSMFGPLVVSAALGTLGWQIVVRRRRDWRLIGLLAAAALPVAAVTLRLVFGADSYAESIQWSYAHFSRFMPYYLVLTEHGWPSFLASTLWVIAFAALFLAGSVTATWIARRDRARELRLVFGWMLFAASLVPALAISLQGASQLFFLYYGLAALAPIAGWGLALAVQALRHGPRRLLASAALLLLVINAGYFASVSPDRSFAEWTAYNQAGFAWRAFNWASDAFKTDADLARDPAPDESAGALGPYAKKLVLTDDLRNGLRWAREHLPKNAVFAANVYDAAPYGGYSERRAFLETVIFTSTQHQAGPLGEPSARYASRFHLLDEWRAGQADAVERLRLAGVTHLFIDRVNGDPVVEPPASQRVFANADFAIYRAGP